MVNNNRSGHYEQLKRTEGPLNIVDAMMRGLNLIVDSVSANSQITKSIIW